MNIVEELRERAVNARQEGNATAEADARYFETAAALIERMAEALRPFADGYKGREGWNDVAYIGGSNICNGDLRRARDILKELGQ